MKIAFLNIYGGTNNRGAESFADKLGALLTGKGYQVDFYTGKQEGMTIVQPEHNVNNPLKRFFIDPASLSVLFFTLKIFPRLWRGNYDWIVPMNSFWQVLLCKFIVKSKLLITGHSGPGWDERWNLWLKPNVFVATTQPTADWAKKVSPWTRVVTIPYGIDAERFAKAESEKIKLERPIILCPAAAVEYKRIDLAIKAVVKLGKGSLLHLGTGPQLEAIKGQGEKLLGNKRFASKAVGYQDIPGYYQASDVVTLPSSKQENSPMVFLEAMAAGKVTVTTDTPRARWLLGSTGIFVDPTDIDEYAIALQAGLDVHPDTNSEVQRFSWGKVLSSYEELLAK